MAVAASAPADAEAPGTDIGSSAAPGSWIVQSTSADGSAPLGASSVQSTVSGAPGPSPDPVALMAERRPREPRLRYRAAPRRWPQPRLRRQSKCYAMGLVRRTPAVGRLA